MPRYPGRNYFIVKHDLASFQALPGFIWNSGNLEDDRPVGFRTVEKGDCWIGFAYTTSGARERAVSLVTGYYRCARPYRYGKIPKKSVAKEVGTKKAWLIKGESMGPPIADPVVIPPLRKFLGDRLFHRRTITRITKKQFYEIRSYTDRHRFKASQIPLLRREPRNEQEVLAIVASDPERLGIGKILRVQTRFPDMLLKVKGKTGEVHLELELYSSSFLAHRHDRQVNRRRFSYKRYGKKLGDGKSVGVLCWINDDENQGVGDCVHKVFELRDLLKHQRPIRW